MTNKTGEMAAEIPEIIRDPTRGNTCHERGRFLGKVRHFSVYIRNIFVQRHFHEFFFQIFREALQNVSN